MSSLTRTLEKRILKTLGLKRETTRFDPIAMQFVPLKKGTGPIMSRDGEINYGRRWPRLIRTNEYGTRPTFDARMSAATA